jgi:aspartyl-tRNA(Asn)/glutamyl-tRNA(Gln) amidotransferase subunit C
MLRDRLAHIAGLARLDPEPATLDRFGDQCMGILNYIEVLSEIDTDAVEPLYSPFEQADAFRPDVATPCDQRAAMLANAPETDGEFFIVPRIV